MSIEDLDDQIGEKSSKNKYLTWVIIGIIIIAAIAVPMILLRQSEPAEATEPTTIEEIRTEVQTLWDTVYGINGLETKIALHAESIADFVAGDCTCPDYSGQFQNINNDLILLRTDLNAIPDYAGNITQLNTDLDALSVGLTAVEATLLDLQAQVDGIAVTDWGSDIDKLTSDLADVGVDIIGLGGRITSLEGVVEGLEVAIADLPTMPRYAVVASMAPSMGSKYLKVDVSGAGYYPVIVTLYGSGLSSTKIWDVDLAGYVITSMPYAGGNILAIFIKPQSSWGETDQINLVIDELVIDGITGSISYASASVGA